jgi:hypothetical protein
LTPERSSNASELNWATKVSPKNSTRVRPSCPSAARQAEKERYIRAYAQDHISQDELGVCLADIKNQLDNLRLLLLLLLDSVEAQVSQKREQAEIAITYRFGPPPVSGSAGSPSQGGLFGDALKNGRASFTPGIDAPTLTVVAVR